MKTIRRITAAACAAFFLLAGCQPAPQPVVNTIRPSSTTAPAFTATPAPSITPTETSTATVAPTATATPPPLTGMCSPLQDVTLAQMPEILQGPLQTPRPGQDDGHHGDDFAFWRFGSHTQMEGLEIHTMLAGVVAGTVTDRNPYGNMVMIETPLENIPEAWLQSLALPTPSPAMTPDARMEECPVDPVDFPNAGKRRSLYLLYGHLKEPTTLKIGDKVTCGQAVGAVGNTGLSGNAHLHLEMRVGPSGATFNSMGYYDPRASAEEFANYCTWRVSQLFQLLDPMVLINQGAGQ